MGQLAGESDAKEQTQLAAIWGLDDHSQNTWNALRRAPSLLLIDLSSEPMRRAMLRSCHAGQYALLDTYILSGQDMAERQCWRRGHALAHMLRPGDLIILETGRLTELGLGRFKRGIEAGGLTPLAELHFVYAPMVTPENLKSVWPASGRIGGHRLICGELSAAQRAAALYSKAFAATVTFEGMTDAQFCVAADLQKTMSGVTPQGGLVSDAGG